MCINKVFLTTKFNCNLLINERQNCLMYHIKQIIQVVYFDTLDSVFQQVQI